MKYEGQPVTNEQKEAQQEKEKKRIYCLKLKK